MLESEGGQAAAYGIAGLESCADRAGGMFVGHQGQGEQSYRLVAALVNVVDRGGR